MKIRSFGNMACCMLLLLAAATGCTQEEWAGKDNGPDTAEFSVVKATIGTVGAADDPNTLGPAEYAIHHARLVVFEPGSTTRVDTTLLVHNKTEQLASGTMTIQMKIKKRNNADTRRNILVIANESPRMTEAFETPGLKDWTQVRNTMFFGRDEYIPPAALTAMHTKADNLSTFHTGNLRLPMTGEGEIDLSGSSATAAITLKRAMARVDVYLQHDLAVQEIDTRHIGLDLFYIKNSGLLIHQGSTSYNPDYETLRSPVTEHNNPAIGHPALLPKKASAAEGDVTNAIRMFTLYMPEREVTDGLAPAIGIQAFVRYPGGAETAPRKKYGNHSIPFPGEGGSYRWIRRNNVYKVYLTLTKAEKIRLEGFTISPWNEQNIDAEIDKNNFQISNSEIRLDYGAQGYSFTNRVSFKSNKPVYYVGFFSESGLQITGAPDSPAPWPNYIEGMVGRPSGETEGTIETTYWVVENPSPPFYVRLRSGKVTKDIKVVYDNGYIPRDKFNATDEEKELIPAALAGVQLAKQGNKLPTESKGTFVSEVQRWTRAEETGTQILPTSSDQIGAGRQNTINMLRSLQVSIAGICKDMSDRSGAVITDPTDTKSWFLPSFNEVKLIPANSANSNGILGESYRLLLGGHSQRPYYWSSSDAGASHAWGYHVIDAVGGHIHKSDNLAFVRCIRAVYATP